MTFLSFIRQGIRGDDAFAGFECTEHYGSSMTKRVCRSAWNVDGSVSNVSAMWGVVCYCSG
jgi:hypothetical protein